MLRPGPGAMHGQARGTPPRTGKVATVATFFPSARGVPGHFYFHFRFCDWPVFDLV